MKKKIAMTQFINNKQQPSLQQMQMNHQNLNNPVIEMDLSKINLAQENQWLKSQLAEISQQRDALLCEVEKLRLELDMAELKRLPEDNG